MTSRSGPVITGSVRDRHGRAACVTAKTNGDTIEHELLIKLVRRRVATHAWRQAGHPGPHCTHELNPVGGRLPESRMSENFTYRSMRRCRKRNQGMDWGTGAGRKPPANRYSPLLSLPREHPTLHLAVASRASAAIKQSVFSPSLACNRSGPSCAVAPCR
jgi:hypothetical protein